MSFRERLSRWLGRDDESRHAASTCSTATFEVPTRQCPRCHEYALYRSVWVEICGATTTLADKWVCNHCDYTEPADPVPTGEIQGAYISLTFRGDATP